MNRNRRIVLRDKDAETKVCALSVDLNWDLVEMIRADPAQNVAYELHFAGFSDDVSVKYVVDPIAECCYVIVSGQDLDKACERVEEKIAHWSTPELLEDWDKAPHDTAQILAMLRIGVAAPFEYDAAFAKKLQEGLTHGDAAVREATLAAIGYRSWREFDELLSDTAQNDPHQRCRNRAATMLQIRSSE